MSHSKYGSIGTARRSHRGSISDEDRALLSTQGQLQPTIGGHLIVAANSVDPLAFVLCVCASLCPPLAVLAWWILHVCFRPGVAVNADRVRVGMVVENGERACEVVKVRRRGRERVELVYVVRGIALGRRTVIASGVLDLRADDAVCILADPYAASWGAIGRARLACAPPLHRIRTILGRGRLLEWKAWRCLIGVAITLTWACILLQLVYHVEHPPPPPLGAGPESGRTTTVGHFIVAEYPLLVQLFIVLLIAGLCSNSSTSSSHYDLVKRAHKRNFASGGPRAIVPTPAHATGVEAAAAAETTPLTMYSSMKSRLRRWQRGRTGRPIFLGRGEFVAVLLVATVRAVLTVCWSSDSRWTGIDLIEGPLPISQWSAHLSASVQQPTANASGAVPLTAILSAAKRRRWAALLGVAFTPRTLVAISALALPIAQSVLLFAILLQLCNDWRYQCVRCACLRCVRSCSCAPVRALSCAPPPLAASPRRSVLTDAQPITPPALPPQPRAVGRIRSDVRGRARGQQRDRIDELSTSGAGDS
jgi:hypothetical protein